MCTSVVRGGHICRISVRVLYLYLYLHPCSVEACNCRLPLNPAGLPRPVHFPSLCLNSCSWDSLNKLAFLPQALKSGRTVWTESNLWGLPFDPTTPFNCNVHKICWNSFQKLYFNFEFKFPHLLLTNFDCILYFDGNPERAISSDF